MQGTLRIGLLLTLAVAGCAYESHDPSDGVWTATGFQSEGTRWEDLDLTLESEGPIRAESLAGSALRDGASTIFALEASRTGHFARIELIASGDVLAPDFAGETSVLQLSAETFALDYSEASSSWASQATLRTVESDATRRTFVLEAVMTDGSALRARVSGTISEPYDYTDPAYPDPGYPDPYAQPHGPIAATWQSFTGTMGGHRGIALSGQSGLVDQYGGTTSIEINTTELGYWVMARLTVQADLSDPDLPDGPVLAAYSTDLLGCTGSAPGNFDFDAHTSDVEVQLGTNDQGQRVLRFNGRFDEYAGGGSVQGDVVLDML